MKRKFLTIALSAAVASSLLVGCGGSNNNESSSASSSSAKLEESSSSSSSESTSSATSSSSESEPVLNKNIDTYLFIGVDQFNDTKEEADEENNYQTNERADMLVLFAWDSENETCKAIQLDPHTMSEVSVLDKDDKEIKTEKTQIMNAHTYGSDEEESSENTAKAVSDLLGGIEIDHYVTMSMDGAEELNDLAGGVSLKITEDLTWIDDSFVEGEIVTLNGEQALKFLRAIDESRDAERMDRQVAYLNALQSTISKSAQSDADFILNMLTALDEYMASDCTIYELSDFANLLAEKNVEEYVTLEGKTEEAEPYSEFIVDEDALHTLVQEMFYTQD